MIPFPFLRVGLTDTSLVFLRSTSCGVPATQVCSSIVLLILSWNPLILVGCYQTISAFLDGYVSGAKDQFASLSNWYEAL